MEHLDARIRKAMTSEREALRGMLRDPSEKVVIALLSNGNITEQELIVLARRRDLSSDTLGAIAGMKAASKEYRLANVLVNNPRTPRRMALSLLRKLRIRDMAFVTRNKSLPTELRQAAEGIVKDKLPTIPLGVRVGLARQVSEELIKVMLLDRDQQQMRACFENPRMKEAVVLWAVNHEAVSPEVIAYISGHPKWAACYSVRFAMARNRYAPIERVIGFVAGLKAMDQRFLYNDPSVPVSVKVQIEIELERKGQPLYPPREEGRIIGIPDEDDADGAPGESE